MIKIAHILTAQISVNDCYSDSHRNQLDTVVVTPWPTVLSSSPTTSRVFNIPPRRCMYPHSLLTVNLAVSFFLLSSKPDDDDAFRVGGFIVSSSSPYRGNFAISDHRYSSIARGQWILFRNGRRTGREQTSCVWPDRKRTMCCVYTLSHVFVCNSTKGSSLMDLAFKSPVPPGNGMPSDGRMIW